MELSPRLSSSAWMLPGLPTWLRGAGEGERPTVPASSQEDRSTDPSCSAYLCFSSASSVQPEGFSKNANNIMSFL